MESHERRPGLVGKVAGAVTGKVVDVVDPNILLDEIDLDRLLQRIDPDDLIARVDINALLDRVDINRLMARVDVDALLEQADIEDVVRRSGIPDIVAASTTHLAGSLIDVVRRQLVGLDTILLRTVDRLLRREPGRMRLGPPALLPAGGDLGASGRVAVTGRYAGPFSRLGAIVLDVLIASAVFTLAVAGLNVLLDVFWSGGVADAAGVWGLVAWAAWGFLYVWVSLAVAGRTPGMALVGVRVVALGGGPVGPGHAFVRTLAMPISVAIAGLGLLLAIVHPRRLALHDVIGRTCVVYDWGDRPAELPGPLSAYVDRHTPPAP